MSFSLYINKQHPPLPQSLYSVSSGVGLFPEKTSTGQPCFPLTQSSSCCLPWQASGHMRAFQHTPLCCFFSCLPEGRSGERRRPVFQSPAPRLNAWGLPLFLFPLPALDAQPRGGLSGIRIGYRYQKRNLPPLLTGQLSQSPAPSLPPSVHKAPNPHTFCVVCGLRQITLTNVLIFEMAFRTRSCSQNCES